MFTMFSLGWESGTTWIPTKALVTTGKLNENQKAAHANATDQPPQAD